VKSALWGSAAFLVVSLWSSVPMAEPAPQRDVASLLFEKPDWTQAPAGSKLSYAFSRKTFGSAVYGESFDDVVKLSLEAGDDPQSRKVEVQMFSGSHRAPAGPFQSTTNNPVLLLTFEKHLQEIAQLFQANPRYLKNAIRKAWRDAPKVEDVSLTVDGKSVPGTRVTIQPFLNDPMKNLMKGLEDLTYTVDIADSIPGEIVAIDIHSPAEGAAKYSESLRYEAETKP
jgi:hypothetical protein